jgi:hypothetical protein
VRPLRAAVESGSRDVPEVFLIKGAFRSCWDAKVFAGIAELLGSDGDCNLLSAATEQFFSVVKDVRLVGSRNFAATKDTRAIPFLIKDLRDGRDDGDLEKSLAALATCLPHEVVQAAIPLLADEDSSVRCGAAYHVLLGVEKSTLYDCSRAEATQGLLSALNDTSASQRRGGAWTFMRVLAEGAVPDQPSGIMEKALRNLREEEAFEKTHYEWGTYHAMVELIKCGTDRCIAKLAEAVLVQIAALTDSIIVHHEVFENESYFWDREIRLAETRSAARHELTRRGLVL